MQIVSVGIDLGKTTFHLVALGVAGKVLVRKKFTQRQLLIYTANMQTSLIGMEACSGAHFLGRGLRKHGHDVRLVAAQFVKPFVKSNKNDYVDAEAIAEAVERKNMRFVPIKTEDQLDLQAIHRVRDRLISRRTAVINQLRGFLLERGLVFAKTPAKLRAALPDILGTKCRPRADVFDLQEREVAAGSPQELAILQGAVPSFVRTGAQVVCSVHWLPQPPELSPRSVSPQLLSGRGMPPLVFRRLLLAS
jgi:transposase